MTGWDVGRERAAEANRVTALLAIPAVAAVAGAVWPAAGRVFGMAVAVLLAVVVTVVAACCAVRRLHERREDRAALAAVPEPARRPG